MNSVPSPQLPSNIKFGWFFAAVFALLGAYFLNENWYIVAIVTFAIASILIAITCISPLKLIYLNRMWFKLGILLGKIISPIVLGIIFFIILTPISLITRMFGRDELKIKKISAKSYWVNRLPPGPDSDSFKNNFRKLLWNLLKRC
jgi:hypothetical protein